MSRKPEVNYDQDFLVPPSLEEWVGPELGGAIATLPTMPELAKQEAVAATESALTLRPPVWTHVGSKWCNVAHYWRTE